MNEIPDGFRETPLGPLPVDWELAQLGAMATLQRGRDLPRREREPGPYPVVGSNGVVGYHSRFAARGPGVCIGRSGSVGEVTFVERDFWPLNTALWVKDFHGNDPTFVAYLLSQVNLATYATGVSVPTLNRNLVHPLPVPLPPLPEQRAIARALRTVQRAREATEDAIAAARELKRSLMRHLFTYGPVPVDEAERVELKETETGPVPACWQLVPLAEVTEKPQYGYTASASEEPIGPRILRITDVQDGRVLWSTVPHCEIDVSSLAKYALERGDVLVARIGATTGKTYLVTDCPQSVFASYLIRLRVDSSRVTASYLHYYTHTRVYWTQVNASKGGRLKQGVSIPVLQSLLLPLPPIPEQHRIACVLDAVNAKIAAEEARRSALDELFRTLLHHLMTGRVRVPIRETSEV